MAYIQDMTGGDISFMSELFGTFLSDVADKLPQMERAFQPFQGRELYQLAHSFAGTATCLGANTLHERAVALEQSAMALRLQESTEAFALFRSELVRTRDFLSRLLDSLG